MASFPGFFLSFLGSRFLGLLYHEILQEDGRVCIVAEDDRKQVVGFAVGVENQVGLYKRLAKKRWWAFAWAALPTAMAHPRVIPRLARALLYRQRAEKIASRALLMSIAVSPERQGGGVGRVLMSSFLGEMSEKQVERVSLTTDRDHNEATNNFYQRLGFSLNREYCTPEGRWMNEYVIETPSGGETARSIRTQ